MSEKFDLTVVGGGLAGCEAAWQTARAGLRVRLVEMKPQERTPAHSTGDLAELVCSNSLRGDGLTGAVGLLKRELSCVGSLLIECARATAVPAGRALAVDRKLFSRAVEQRLEAEPSIEIVRARFEEIDLDRPTIIATGPLTDGPLLERLESLGATLSYHDAIAPLVSADSLDRDVVFAADRYEEPSADSAYINCPFDEEQYMAFVKALVEAEKAPLRDFETAPFFEGCLPVEEMAARGPLTLAHGPLKPVGLVDPRTGERAFAVAQLRPEDAARTSYNLVGFQTRLKRGEQRRVFRMIPGLENASFERLGQVHRNTFVDAPRVLDGELRLNEHPNIRLAGQITGVEGYVESIASGFLAGTFAAARVSGRQVIPPPSNTALGGLLAHTARQVANFQPSNVVWGMIETPPKKRRQKKRERRLEAAEQAVRAVQQWWSEAR